jgi:hypothetical protein
MSLPVLRVFTVVSRWEPSPVNQSVVRPFLPMGIILNGVWIERVLLSLIWWEHGEHHLSHMVGRRMGVLGGLFCVTNLVIKKQ